MLLGAGMVMSGARVAVAFLPARDKLAMAASSSGSMSERPKR